MNEFMVSWDDGSLQLQTAAAAKILKQSFQEEGREARAFGRTSPASEWTELA